MFVLFYKENLIKVSCAIICGLLTKAMDTIVLDVSTI